MAQRVIDGVVLITGASSGIGAGLAVRLHARGAHAIISGRDQERLDSVAAGHPRMSVVVMDVADPESVTRAMTEVAACTSHLTTLVNNAGIQRLLDFSAAEPPEHDDIASEIATNFTGLVTVTAAALPFLRRAERSRVVNVGSGLGFVPYSKGMDSGKDEIAIGLARASQVGARVAPKRLFSLINRDDQLISGPDTHPSQAAAHRRTRPVTGAPSILP